jgi:hypothetical protein
MLSLSLTFRHRSLVYASLHTHTGYIPHTSHSCPCYHRNNIGWGVQIIKLFFLYFSPVTPSLLVTNILLNSVFSNTLCLRSSLNVSDQVSHTYKTTGQIIFLNISIFNSFVTKLRDERLEQVFL